MEALRKKFNRKDTKTPRKKTQPQRRQDAKKK